MKIAVLVAQKTRAVLIDIPAHDLAIEVSHDRVPAAVVCGSPEPVHRVVIEFFPHLYSTDARAIALQWSILLELPSSVPGGR